MWLRTAASVVVLPEPGRAGHEHEAAVLLGEALDPGRKPQRLEARHLARDDAERERDVAALAERVDAEARQAGPLVGRVELAGLLEGREPRRRVGADLPQDLLEPLRIERRPVLERLEVAVEADDRRLPDLQVDVARAEVDGGVQAGDSDPWECVRQKRVDSKAVCPHLSHP